MELLFSHGSSSHSDPINEEGKLIPNSFTYVIMNLEFKILDCFESQTTSESVHCPKGEWDRVCET
jgi:hypothetical protein